MPEGHKINCQCAICKAKRGEQHHSVDRRKDISKAMKEWWDNPKNAKKIMERNKKLKGRIGNKNFNWKGGHTVSGGYIYTRCNNHPFKVRGGYVAEHRLVMEKWLRENEPDHPALIEIDGIKYLRKEWIPHHKNGVSDDNCIENLELMTVFEHHSFHMKGSKHPQYGKSLSEETKKKLSLALSADKNPMYGRHHTEETKKNLSLIMKGIVKHRDEKGRFIKDVVSV